MNKQQAAIHHAKALIENGTTHYICCALVEVTRTHQNLAQACRLVSWRVAAGLDSWPTFGSWYASETGSKSLINHTGNANHAALARMAWLDKLYLEFA